MEELTETYANEIRRVFELQKPNQPNVAATTVQQRRNKLKELLDSVYAHSKEIEDAVYADFKKPSAEARLSEVYPVITELKKAIKHLGLWMKPQRIPAPLIFFGSSNKVMYEPKGVTLIISPWNFPFQLALGPVISSIAAGNTVILKPSEASVHTSSFLKKFLANIFEESEVAVFEGDYKVSKALVELPFDHIFFTGSPNVGKLVMAGAAKNLTSVTLELGGKSPVIIDGSADLKEAAKRITWGKFLNCGQSCVAPDYLLLPQKIVGSFVDFSKEFILKFYGSSANIKDNPDYCRIINAPNFFRIKELIDDAISGGAKIEFGGTSDSSDKFIAPTILSNVSMESGIMREEIFGPVLPIISYSHADNISEVINKNPKPLALYVFSKNKKFINKILHTIPAGTAAVNDVVVQFVNANSPFGGINSSGIGKSHGYYGFKEFSNIKPVMKQPKLSGITLLYPPYTKTVKKLIDLGVKYF